MFSNKDLERYSRQIILKKVGILGQKKIQNTKVLVVGCGGLGIPVIDLLCRAGIGEIGMMDHDKVSISNLHRQVMFISDDVGKYKVNILKKKINKINKKIKVKTYRVKAEDKNLGKILKQYDVIVDGTDNFKAKFLLNKFSLKYKKKLITGAISKFEGHIFTFTFLLILLIFFFKILTLYLPTSSEMNITCRCKFDILTLSCSIIPISPIPARQSKSITGVPKPPHPTTKTLAF